MELFLSEPRNRRLTSTLEIFFGCLFGFHIYELHKAGLIPDRGFNYVAGLNRGSD